MSDEIQNNQDELDLQDTTEEVADPGLAARDQIAGGGGGEDVPVGERQQLSARDARSADDSFDPTWTEKSRPDGTQPDVEDFDDAGHTTYGDSSDPEVDRDALRRPVPMIPKRKVGVNRA